MSTKFQSMQQLLFQLGSEKINVIVVLAQTSRNCQIHDVSSSGYYKYLYNILDNPFSGFLHIFLGNKNIELCTVLILKKCKKKCTKFYFMNLLVVKKCR